MKMDTLDVDFLEVPLLMAVIWTKVLDQKLLLFASKAFHHSPRTLQPVSSSGAPCDMYGPCGPPLAKIMGSSVMWPDDLEHLYYSYLMLLDVYLHTGLKSAVIGRTCWVKRRWSCG